MLDDVATENELRRENASLRALLSECREAMNEASRRYRISWQLSGTDPGVAGWVEWLERMQNKIYHHLQSHHAD